MKKTWIWKLEILLNGMTKQVKLHLKNRTGTTIIQILKKYLNTIKFALACWSYL